MSGVTDFAAGSVICAWISAVSAVVRSSPAGSETTIPRSFASPSIHCRRMRTLSACVCRWLAEPSARLASRAIWLSSIVPLYVGPMTVIATASAANFNTSPNLPAPARDRIRLRERKV